MPSDKRCLFASVAFAVTVLLGCSTSPEIAKPTLDTRPEYQGLKPPVRSLSTPGADVQSLAVGKKVIRVGQKMTDVFDVLPAPEVEDSEDDPGIQITSPFGTIPGMIYVYRYRVADGKRVVIRYRRDVPRRPWVGEAGNVQQPFVISRITVEE